MRNYLFVFLGGGLGAAARYWLSGIVYRWVESDFPYGTLLVNFLGCLLIGLLMALMQDRFQVTTALRIFLTIGILGGFTTFSTFSYETISLFRDSEYFAASANVLVSMVACLGGTYGGSVLGRMM